MGVLALLKTARRSIIISATSGNTLLVLNQNTLLIYWICSLTQPTNEMQCTLLRRNLPPTLNMVGLSLHVKFLRLWNIVQNFVTTSFRVQREQRHFYIWHCRGESTFCRCIGRSTFEVSITSSGGQTVVWLILRLARTPKTRCSTFQRSIVSSFFFCSSPSQHHGTLFGAEIPLPRGRGSLSK